MGTQGTHCPAAFVSIGSARSLVALAIHGLLVGICGYGFQELDLGSRMEPTQELSCSVAPFFPFGGGPTKNGLPQKGFPIFFSRVTEQLREG